jgi:hypothetical protein
LRIIVSLQPIVNRRSNFLAVFIPTAVWMVNGQKFKMIFATTLTYTTVVIQHLLFQMMATYFRCFSVRPLPVRLIPQVSLAGLTDSLILVELNIVFMAFTTDRPVNKFTSLVPRWMSCSPFQGRNTPLIRQTDFTPRSFKASSTMTPFLMFKMGHLWVHLQQRIVHGGSSSTFLAPTPRPCGESEAYRPSSGSCIWLPTRTYRKALDKLSPQHPRE